MKPSFAERSADTSWLVKRLMQLAVGEVVTYDELNAGIGRDVRKSGRGSLVSARRILENTENRLYDPVLKVGLKRMNDKNVLDGAGRALRHVSKTARRTLKRLGNICNRANLTLDDQKTFDVTAASCAMIHVELSPTVQKRLSEKCVHVEMPSKNLVEALKDCL